MVFPILEEKLMEVDLPKGPIAKKIKQKLFDMAEEVSASQR
eukprot:SAG22_NODE_11445_length_485_cov_0.458549_2_plen_41_part_00